MGFLHRLRDGLLMLISQKLFLLGIAVLVVLGGLFWLGNGGPNGHETILVTRQDLTQEVYVTGTVTPAEKASLAFEQSGRVTELKADVGDLVAIGQELVILDQSELSADLSKARAALDQERGQLQQYQAAVDSAQAKLSELEKGTRTEELKLSETELQNAEKVLNDRERIAGEERSLAQADIEKSEQSLEDAQANLEKVTQQTEQELTNLYLDVPDLLREAFTAADLSLRFQTADLFDLSFYQSLSNQFGASFDTINVSLEAEARDRRSKAILELAQWEDELDVLGEEPEELEAALEKGKTSVGVVRNFLIAARDLLGTVSSSSVSDIITFRNDVDSALSRTNSALELLNNQRQAIALQKTSNANTLQTAQEKLNSAERELSLAKVTGQQRVATAEGNVTEAENQLSMASDELSLKQAGAREEEINGQKASVREQSARLSTQVARIRQSEAEIQRIEAQLEKMIMRSPIDGVVTRLDLELGEIITPQTVVAAVISTDRYEVEANIPEIDIAKLQIDDAADITLDAYGPEFSFPAHVMFIDPAETIVDDVTNYEVTFQFDEHDERIRSGMTANIQILTQEWEGVLAVPEYALDRQADGVFLWIVPEGKRPIDAVKTAVEIGAVSSDGFRILEGGVDEGDVVLVPEQ